MSLVGKNRKLFSYKNEDRKQRHYMYKDFEKTKSYKTDFSYSSFTGVSLRAAQMKYCNFNHVCFSGVDFIGTNLCGSTFKGASFSDCIFSSTKLKHTSFTDSVFQNCYFIGIGIASAKGLYRDTEGITFLDRMPSQVLTVHKHTVSQGKGKDKRWFPRVNDPQKKQYRRIAGNTEEDIFEKLYPFYFAENVRLANINLKELYPKWRAYKLTVTTRPNTVKRLDSDFKRCYLNEPLSRDILTKPLSKIGKADPQVAGRKGNQAGIPV